MATSDASASADASESDASADSATPDAPDSSGAAAPHPLQQAVPFVRTLGLEFAETTAEHAVLRLPDDPRLHNHIGGPHAGAMWSLAESASGAIVLAAFSAQLEAAVPLAVRAEIDFLKPAMGPVTAEAVLGRSAAGIVAELDGGHRPEFPVDVELRTGDGTVTGRMSIVWTLKPHRR